MKTTNGSAKHSFSKKAVCLSVTAALAVSAFAGMGVVSMTANATPAEEYGLMDNIQDGVILHCFDWKYSSGFLCRTDLSGTAGGRYRSVVLAVSAAVLHCG